jgi:hypothetical protein
MSSFYEIHELSTGEIILKRSDEEGNSEPLVTIRFSAESLGFLGDARFKVAKAMIEAGMEAASELAEQHTDDLANEQIDLELTVLH